MNINKFIYTLLLLTNCILLSSNEVNEQRKKCDILASLFAGLSTIGVSYVLFKKNKHYTGTAYIQRRYIRKANTLIPGKVRMHMNGDESFPNIIEVIKNFNEKEYIDKLEKNKYVQTDLGWLTKYSLLNILHKY